LKPNLLLAKFHLYINGTKEALGMVIKLVTVPSILLNGSVGNKKIIIIPYSTITEIKLGS